ncbi:ATP-binding protein [Streptomyces chartreusis]|uniref:ATP-binding protein n=1 Tax=Streptomyces chartreusis TaxID=1969 RepID=UPI0036B1BE1E
MPVAAPGPDRGGLRSTYVTRSASRITLCAPAQPQSVGHLRKRASMIFSAWMLNTDETQAAELVISELLTNAVEHGHDKMTLGVARTGSALEITVADHGQAARSTSLGDPDEHGRGLAIVAAIAQDLSIDKTAGGWRTLARIALQSPMSDSAA